MWLLAMACSLVHHDSSDIEGVLLQNLYNDNAFYFNWVRLLLLQVVLICEFDSFLIINNCKFLLML